MTTATLQYSATIITSTNESFTFTGEQPLAMLTAASFMAAASAMGADIGNQLVNGTPQDAGVNTQVTTDQTSD